jgi:hypothetical protein
MTDIGWVGSMRINWKSVEERTKELMRLAE